MRPLLALPQAQALVRRAFVRLWQSEFWTVRQAVAWLLRHHNVERIEELGSVAQCELVARDIARIWQERCADPCGTCRLPVRQDHAHAIVGGELFHVNCVPPPEVSP